VVKGSTDPPLVPLLPLLTVVTLPAAKDDGVNEPAMEAFGVILGPPPEFVEGDAWEPGDDESILACMAETYIRIEININLSIFLRININQQNEMPKDFL
jgi:hypothetical protein